MNRKQRRAVAKGSGAGGKPSTAFPAMAKPADTIAERFAVAQRLHQSGHLAQAEVLYRQILALNPRHVESLNHLGLVALQTGHPDDAVDLIRNAIALNRRIPEFHCNLGTALQNQAKLDEAVASYRRALALKPNFTDALSNLGNILLHQGKPAEAAVCYRKAIDLQPDFPEAHFNHSTVLLLEGKFHHGWQEFEWRWRRKDFELRHPVHSRWRGDDLNGRTILLHAEQGLGDSIQFVRYAPLVARRGATVLVEAQRPLVTLFSGMEGVSGVFAQGDRLPAFDYHCPFMSLPLAFATTLDTIPSTMPYLRADAERVAGWRRRVAPLPGLRVGLVWAGTPLPSQLWAHAMDQRRSITLDHFANFAAMDGVSFVSLQKGKAAFQTKTPPAGLAIQDWTNELNDFADTAALVEALDLVIGVDTSVIHLAGALGKPVWLINRFDTCWRWLLERDDSPWYPTLRQFRQQSPGDWNSVLSRVHSELRLTIAAAKGKLG